MKKHIAIYLFLLVTVAGCDTIGLSTTLASDEADLDAIAVDNTDVYWATCTRSWSFSDDRVMRTPKNGGNSEIITSKQFCPLNIYSDGTYIYWLSRSAIMRNAKTRGIATVFASSYDIRTFVVDETDVYWIECHLAIKTAMVMKRSKQGGDTTRIAWVSSCASGLAEDTTSVYWLDGLGLNRVLKNGEGGTNLGRLRFQPGTIIADETNLFWIEGDYIWRLSKIGGNPERLAENVGDQNLLTMDATHLYWRDRNNVIMKVAKIGGAPTIVLSEPKINRVVVDAAHIYWTSENKVMRKIK